MTTAIETNGLTKRYGSGDSAVVAVDGLDLRVEKGEVFGFLGHNGAGKSTTINMLLDYIRPTEGTATVLGMDVHDESEALRERVGVLPEGFGLYDRLSGRRHIEFAIDWKDADDDPSSILERVGLGEDEADKRVGGYSKGMQQRLALGMALVGDPDLLILDEPSSGLDPHGIRQMRELVREEAKRGTTVFFSSHILGQVEAVCDRVGILNEGELVAVDTVEGLRRTVGAGSELQLRVTGDIDVDVSRFDNVDSVSRSDGILRVTPSDSRAKAEVVTRLTNAGVDILDVNSEEASLEDVFTAYTTEVDSREKEKRSVTVQGVSP
ncbi:MAG: ABC transporter ATP-binding protein [Halobacteria archaeon]|nr:ABC transporter ATP-binding protein [Halobacteria archaeon]